MSHTEQLEIAARRATEASERADAAALLLNSIINGTDFETVSTESGVVPTIAKAIKNISDEISMKSLAPVSEESTIEAEGQQSIAFMAIKTDGISLYIKNEDDSYQRYFDFEVTTTNTVRLGKSFPVGTVIRGVSFDFGGELATATQQADASAKTSRDWATKTGSTVDGEQYSSKKYADDARSSEDAAKLYRNTANDHRNDAASSADAAKVSETAAKNSEKAAKASEESSSTSALNAKASEENASVSATKAKASEDAAKVSEGNAKTHAEKSLASETAAKSSEDAAKSAQTNSKSSETEAATYATEARTAQNAAATSATEARTAQNAAATSATEARTAQNAAATSATKALASENAAKKSEDVLKASQDATKISETNAATHVDTSKDWATKTDATVDGTEYSAKKYATDAKDSEVVVKASQDAAKISEDAAKISEDAAKISETTAAISADKAIASEDSAKASQDAAKISETKAAISANKAIASEDAAKASQDAAKAFESNIAAHVGTARDWATKTDTTVDGTEYSSKHYAIEAKENKDAANSYMLSTKSAAEDADTSAQESQEAAAQAATSATSAMYSEINSSDSASKASTSSENAALSEQNASKASDSAAKSAEEAAQHVSYAAAGAEAVKKSADSASKSAEEASLSEQNASKFSSDAADSKDAASLLATEIALTAESVSHHVAASAVSESNAESYFNDFSKKYLGSRSYDTNKYPSGEVLEDGALYFNKKDKILKVWDTTRWIETATAIDTIYDSVEHTNVAGKNTFSVEYDVGLIQVLYNGVYLSNNKFTAEDGVSVVLSESVTDSDDVVTFIRWGKIAQTNWAGSGHTGDSPWCSAVLRRSFSGNPDLSLITSSKYPRTEYRDGDQFRFKASIQGEIYFYFNNTIVSVDRLPKKKLVTITGSELPLGYIRYDVPTTITYDAANDWFIADRMIERGENENGAYIRFADGTIEMFSKNININTPNSTRWTFPAEVSWKNGDNNYLGFSARVDRQDLYSINAIIYGDPQFDAAFQAELLGARLTSTGSSRFEIYGCTAHITARWYKS